MDQTFPCCAVPIMCGKDFGALWGNLYNGIPTLVGYYLIPATAFLHTHYIYIYGGVSK